jgi:hypothetical protein
MLQADACLEIARTHGDGNDRADDCEATGQSTVMVIQVDTPEARKPMN